MHILVTGGTGFIGRALVPHLRKRGHDVSQLRRFAALPGEPTWDPDKGTIDRQALDRADGIIHLAGENIAAGRWTPGKKALIRDSRVKSTRFLAEAIAKMAKPPKWLICASAVGYYGDKGEQSVTESAAPGDGFLAEVCRDWEAAAAPAEKKGVRVAFLRMGIVLDRKGGALERMLPPFRLGLGGRLGSGRQYMPWIRMDDVLGAVQHIIDKNVSGPVNLVAPGAVTNAEFTRILGRILGRPAVLPAPAFALRLALGEMADRLLLEGVRAEPAALQKSGYAFKYPTLEPALQGLLRS